METLHSKTLASFDDFSRLLESLYQASIYGLSPGKARINRPGKRAHYTETASQLEAWARPYWGIIPLTLGYSKDNKPLPAWMNQPWEIFRTGISNGTNPDHSEYWGLPKDFDQRFVEMAALALAILLCPEHSLKGLPKASLYHIAQWFDRGLYHDIPRNNWRYFRIFALLAVIRLVDHGKLTYPQDQLVAIGKKIHEDLELLESCYLGDGWYSDGLTPQRDYYVSFAMHYYPLVLQSLVHIIPKDSLGSNQDDGAISILLAPPVTHGHTRAREFAASLRWWFDDQGRAIAFGRSMTYRFAQAGFWSVLATIEELPQEIRIASFQYAQKNISWWMNQPIFLPDGTLSIGYRYENHTMAESYNSFGSPYWAFKGFWFLACGEQAPWWKAEQSTKPFEILGDSKKPTDLQPHATCLLRRDYLDHRQTHSWMLCAGQDTHFQPGNTPEKYAKYAYSSILGFGVSADRRGLPHTSSDNTTLITDDGLYWRSREKTVDHTYGEEYLESTWRVWNGETQLRTRLEFTPKGYKRIQRLTTSKSIGLIEGGFAVPWLEEQEETIEDHRASINSMIDSEIVSNHGTTLMPLKVTSSISCSSEDPGFPTTLPPQLETLGITKDSLGGQVIPLPASSHLLFQKAVVPAVVMVFPPGTYEFCTEVEISFL